MKEAACIKVDPELFFTETSAVHPPAEKICEPCTVKNDCLMFALLTENPETRRYGYFGNTKPIDRSRLYEVLKGQLK